MKRKTRTHTITVLIGCDATTCGRCHLNKWYYGNERRCEAYSAVLIRSKGKILRCEECIEREMRSRE